MTTNWLSKLFLYSNTASAGVSIPYPSISLHAIQSLPQPTTDERQGLYMQLLSTEEADGNGEDTEPDSISVTIIPTASAPPAAATETDPAEDKPEQTPVLAMFTALSNCSNLHPDPIDEEDDGEQSRLFQAGLALPGMSDGGLPPAMPGSGGWITAENMHEFVDADGNWIETEETEETETGELGPGAGTVRPRQEEETTNGHAGDDAADETKWQRTS
jgi:nucleotide-sensitive chloride channel 1A